METKEQTKLRFLGVDFPNIVLKSIKPFVQKKDSSIDVTIHPKFFFPKNKHAEFKIIMDVQLSVEGFFYLNIVGIGNFELSNENLTNEEKKHFINGNSTAIMFPYMRALVTTLTSNIGNVTTPIILPARFFKGEIEEIMPAEFNKIVKKL